MLYRLSRCDVALVEDATLRSNLGICLAGRDLTLCRLLASCSDSSAVSKAGEELLSASRKHPMSAGTTSPEAQPLLNSSEPRKTYHDDPICDPPRSAGLGDEESSDPLVPNDASAQRTRSWSTIAFQSVITLLSLVVVGLFIKGFIDADDVEVWFCLEWCSRWGFLTCGWPSSTWAALS